MVAWLLEVVAGALLAIIGVGLWALPTDTPLIGRPPMLAGWLLIAVGALNIVIVTARRYAGEARAKRRQEPEAVPAALSSAPTPAQNGSAQHPPRSYSSLTTAELLRLGATEGLTEVERDRLLAPHKNSWHRVEGVVIDVTPTLPLWVDVQIQESNGGPKVMAFFWNEMDRAAALNVGAEVHLAGRFERVGGSAFVVLEECELLD